MDTQFFSTIINIVMGAVVTISTGYFSLREKSLTANQQSLESRLAAEIELRKNEKREFEEELEAEKGKRRELADRTAELENRFLALEAENNSLRMQNAQIVQVAIVLHTQLVNNDIEPVIDPRTVIVE